MKAIIPIIMSAIICQAAPIELTDTQGRKITVEVLGVADQSVNVRKTSGEEFVIPLANLSADSQKLATEAATPVPSTGAGRVKLTSVSNAIGKVTDQSWETSWGSYDKEVFRSRGVTITVVATQPGKGILEMHWIGSKAGRASNREVVVFSKKEVELVAGEPQTHEFAALFVESDAKYVALGHRDRDGLKYAGWVARVISPEGLELAVIAARPPLIAMIGKPDPTQEEFP